MAESSQNFRVFPCLVVAFTVDDELRSRIIPVEIELSAARLLIGVIILIRVSVSAADPAAFAASRGQQRKRRRQHCNRTNPLFSHFLPPVSFIFYGVPSNQPFTPEIAKDSIKYF